ncbi:response regulator transcription factor [Paenibacillus alba]|uniref:Response regulator n=1 Tax=Paenibacillus alba TaxID=1197127 RepID=A0ABU6GE93_9BACL|nr:response regulator [Paenibacillus alba]MEC0232563.1 response regulator [Paenibacillus alba]
MMIQILLVEDELNLRSRFRKLLEDVIGGCKVTGEASNGLEALEWLKTNTVDAVITDIRMKDMNGIELMKRLKEQSPLMPVVIISGYSDFGFAREALRYEVTDYLLKPVDRVELTQVIQKIAKKINGLTPVSDHKDVHTLPLAEQGIVDNPIVEERQIIRRIKEIIALRLEQDISLQYLAEQVNLNHRYLSVLFKTETGENLSDYVTQCRIEKAKNLIKHTQLKIQDISRLVGYPNAKYFMSVFKQTVGSTPTEYRDHSH